MGQGEREAHGRPLGPQTTEGEREALSEPASGKVGRTGQTGRSAKPSRARAKSEGHPGWPKMLRALAEGTPQDIAAGLHGLNPETVTSLSKADPRIADELCRARSKGAQALRARMGTSPDWKREAWELERFAPKVFHLPNRVAVGQDPDAAPVQSDVRVTLELAQAGARDDYDGPMPALPATTRKR